MAGPKNDQVGTTSTAQDHASSAVAAGKSPAIDRKNHAKTCWLLSKDLDGPIVAGNSTKIEAKLAYVAAKPRTPFLGVRLGFPLGVGDEKQFDNEAAGFGVRHQSDSSYNAHPRPLIPHNVHEITLQFPRDRFTYDDLQPVPEDLRHRFAATGHLTAARVKLNEGEKVRVLGWGKPFANKSDSEVEAWVNDNKPIIDDITLLDITRQTEFLLVVANEQKSLGIKLSGLSLPPALDYGYGKPKPWDEDKYTELWRKNLSSERFEPAYFFDNIDDFLTVATQAPAQDVLWVHKAACDIRESRFSAYAIPDPEHDGVYYIVIRLPKHFSEAFSSAWARLAKEQVIGVVFVKDQEGSQDGGRSDKDVAKWNCRIVSCPQDINHLANHRVVSPDLVVRGYCRDETSESVEALKTFPSRDAAEEALEIGEDQ
ncbi:hypothetical protein C8035_v007600 [Colletotrichum spinosum]|uniref:Uncharacterized protein n=1 Tax=Colletotrichum spinosum TaxID=1347390 RepID=A0A4R8PW13_9PEZI|nr:hypothetical protein C8035_v007600 [Colletotrichum spinosum]